MNNFWKKLKQPFFVLAPMSGITNIVFREVISDIGKPDVFFTEFVSCEGICSEGREILLKDLKFRKKEKPIVVQFFGSNPSKFFQCAKLAKKLKFDGVDINMGCPDRSVLKQKAGASLINNFELSEKIIKAIKKGAGDIPVSVKTRISSSEKETEKWFSFLLNQNLDAITIHGRTKKQIYSGKANWNSIKKLVEMSKSIKNKPIIIGNGDIKNLEEGKEMYKFSGVNGIMIGRGIILNPWLFSGREIEDISIKERINIFRKHLSLLEKNQQKEYFDEIKKYYLKMYISNFIGSKELRIKLMLSKSISEAENILKNFIS